ncbi:MAG TPA: hypothetical protein VFX85_12990 [Solirubrobacterales bacterium]|nr:hypothetical protein [Solirubrobacterales bacterium]
MSAATAETIVVSSRFNGPQTSGNGGYTSGLLAKRFEGAAEVNLRSPVPLDELLELAEDGQGALRLLQGETLIAEARPAPDFEVAVPAPVSPEEARRAAANYRGLEDGLFSHCFVCGRAREDGFDVFAGRVEGRDLAATPWTPPAWTADANGAVQAEFVWAALDCPTYFATHLDGELTLSMLVRQRARIDAPIVAGQEHVVVAWPISQDGRKRLAGGAVLSASGETLATCDALLIEPRSA